jgi:aerobic carbon-monoxide dehydrogenase medium subunit
VTSVGTGELLVPDSREDAIAAFGDGEGVTVFGGGTILMPELNYGRIRPGRTILLHAAGLDGIRRDGSTLIIGAMTSVADLVDSVEPLASAARNVGDPEIRAQATIGGNLCAPVTAENPRGDLQAALISLGARVRFADRDGERTEPVEDFLSGAASGRLVLEVEVDEPLRAAHAGLRRPHAHTYTILAACAAETSTGIRIGLTGAGKRSIRAHAVEHALADGATPGEAADKVHDDAEPADDALASVWYRRRMLPVVVRRAIEGLRSEHSARKERRKGNTI